MKSTLFIPLHQKSHTHLQSMYKTYAKFQNDWCPQCKESWNDRIMEKVRMIKGSHKNNMHIFTIGHSIGRMYKMSPKFQNDWRKSVTGVDFIPMKKTE